MTMIIIGAVLIVLGATLMPWLSRRSAARAEMFAEVPRYDCAQVAGHGEDAPGMRVSVVGKAEPAGPAPLVAPASGRECVWYRLTISERHREVDRDKDGSTRTRIVERQVSDERSHDAFAVADATGRVLVDPDGADIDDPVETVDRVESVARGGMTLSLGAFSFDIGGSDSLVGVRTKEHIVPLGEELYVLAGAGVREGTGVLGRPREGDFVVSTRTSDELSTRARRIAKAIAVGGFVIGFAGGALVVWGVMG